MESRQLLSLAADPLILLLDGEQAAAVSLRSKPVSPSL